MLIAITKTLLSLATRKKHRRQSATCNVATESVRARGRARALAWLRRIGWVVLALSVFAPTVAQAAWYNSNWQYRKQITIQSSQVPANQTNFPVLINLASDGDLAASAQTDGGDILFTSSNGTTKLDHEIEKYVSGTGELVAWVEVPSLSGSVDTVLYMYYGNAAVADQWNINGTWDEGGANNYKGVWHLNEDVVDEQTTGTHSDSTSNNNDGTQNGNDDIAGKIGTAQDFDGNDTVSVPEDNSLDTPTQLTASYWHRPPASTGVHPRTLDKQGSWDIKYNECCGTGNPDFSQQGGGGSAEAGSPIRLNIDDTGVWQHFAVTFNSGTTTWYYNGADVGLFNDDTVASNVNTDSGFYIGGWDGAQMTVGPIDEARLSNIARSGGWITAEYNNQDSPSTFVIEGTPATP